MEENQQPTTHVRTRFQKRKEAERCKAENEHKNKKTAHGYKTRRHRKAMRCPTYLVRELIEKESQVDRIKDDSDMEDNDDVTMT